MPHIVVADPIHPDGIERLATAPGVTLDHLATATGEPLADRLRHADGLIVRGTPVDEALLAKAERLRVVCRHGVGYDLVDVPALTRRGIALMIKEFYTEIRIDGGLIRIRRRPIYLIQTETREQRSFVGNLVINANRELIGGGDDL